jgi:hypothetical protein
MATAGIPKDLLLEARPIGVGPSFHPAPAGAVAGRCARRLGPRSAAHVEVFAANRVVIVPAGIGVRAPLTLSAGRIAGARCYGALVTLEPTGVVLMRAHEPIPLSSLFRSWGQPLSPSRLGSFGASPGTHVAVFVDGRRWRGTPGSVPLVWHSEIVLEVGPRVPPHRSFAFAPGV